MYLYYCITGPAFPRVDAITTMERCSFTLTVTEDLISHQADCVKHLARCIPRQSPPRFAYRPSHGFQSLVYRTGTTTVFRSRYRRIEHIMTIISARVPAVMCSILASSFNLGVQTSAPIMPTGHLRRLASQAQHLDPSSYLCQHYCIAFQQFSSKAMGLYRHQGRPVSHIHDS